MDMNTLKQQIASNTYPHKLVFVGEEYYLQKQFINLITKTINGEYHYYNEYSDIEDDIKSNSFFDESQVYVIKNSNYMLKNYKKFLELEVPNDKVLILIYDEIDAKKEFFKEIKDFLYEFNKMGEKQLKMIIGKFLELNNRNSSLLCEMVDNDCSRLVSEINKLAILKKTMSFLNDNDLFNYAMKEELIYREEKSNLISLRESILDNDYNKAFEINNSFEKDSNDIFKLINSLYDEIKKLWLKQSNIDIKYLLQEKVNFLQKLDRDIKSGKIDNNIAFDYLILNTSIPF